MSSKSKKALRDDAYDESYTALNPLIIVTAANQFMTNYLDVGVAGGTSTVMFYRVRLIP
jgi:hypothetical protein